MTREELKRLWLSQKFDPNRKETNTIVVEVGNNKFWKGYGYVTITSDGPNGYSRFSTHEKNPLQYALDRMNEGFDGIRDLSKYKLIIPRAQHLLFMAMFAPFMLMQRKKNYLDKLKIRKQITEICKK